MPETKTIFENDEIKVSSTGRDYDFVATVENKTDQPLAVAPGQIQSDNEFFEPFVIEPGDWHGVETGEDGDHFLTAARAMSLEVADPSRFEMIDLDFGTDFADQYPAEQEEVR